jgi:putative membrane protein
VRKNEVWKGCAAGIAGGLAATLVMTGFQSAWNAIAKTSKDDAPKTNGNGPRSISQQLAEIRYSESIPLQEKKSSEKENPTEKVAAKMVAVSGKRLSPEAKKTGGTVVHYAFGTIMGGLYGAALEFAPSWHRRNAIPSGLLMGSALFAAADEIALPAMQLAESPAKAPMSMHAYGLASHLVYGATAGLLTRAFRKVM